jgi:hypothetical protein
MADDIVPQRLKRGLGDRQKPLHSYPARERMTVQPTCVLVVGAHRSGTSAIARTINLLGAAVPEPLVPPHRSNPSGFWEPREMVEAHDRLLEACGSRWDDPRPLSPKAFTGPASDACRRALREMVHRGFGESRLLVLKDPRLCRVAPVLLEILAEAGAKPLIVLPHRSPAAVARSLKLRDGFATDRAYAIWLGHVLEAERLTRGLRRIALRTEQFATDPIDGAQSLARDLGCFETGAVDAAAADIAAYWAAGQSAGTKAPPATPDDPVLAELVVRGKALLAPKTGPADPSPAEADRLAAAFADWLAGFERKRSEVLQAALRAMTVPPEFPRGGWRWLARRAFTRLREPVWAAKLKRAGVFDPNFYLTKHPEVAAVGLDPLTHYLRYGALVGLDPSPDLPWPYLLHPQNA